LRPDEEVADKTKKSAKKKSQPKTRRSATKRKLTNAEWLRAAGPARKRRGGCVRRAATRLGSAQGGTLMAIHFTHLETLQAVIATALNIVKNRTLADLHVRKNYTGEFRIRVRKLI
jgi:hypothetical protein